MNKAIKIDVVVAAVLLLVGTIFKTNHWPGANILMTIGAATGILLFILLLISMPKKQLNGLEIVSISVASVSLMLAFLTFTFKMLHWPGAGKLIWITDIAIILAAIIYLADVLMEKDAVKMSLKTIAFFFILNLLLLIFLFVH